MTFSPLLLPSMTPRSSCIFPTDLEYRKGLNRLLPDNPLCDISNSRSILQPNQSIDQSIKRLVIGMSAGSPRSDKASAALATKKKTMIAVPPPQSHARACTRFVHLLSLVSGSRRWSCFWEWKGNEHMQKVRRYLLEYSEFNRIILIYLQH